MAVVVNAEIMIAVRRRVFECTTGLGEPRGPADRRIADGSRRSVQPSATHQAPIGMQGAVVLRAKTGWKTWLPRDGQ